MRDAILMVSGSLEAAPPERSALASLDPFVDDEFNFRLSLKPEQVEQPIRSVYLPIVRGSLPELFKLFDFADPGRPVSQRDETLVPAQSSFLMNSPWMIDQSRRLARRLLVETPDDDTRRIDRLFQRCLARPPTPDERDRLLEYLQQPEELLVVDAKATAQSAGENVGDQLDPQLLELWTSLCQVILTSAEFRHLQ